jgi:excisionase family DNA binding protein
MSITIGPLAHSVSDAAQRIGISRSLLYLLISRGDIPITKVRHRTVVLDDDLRAYLTAHRVIAEQRPSE